VIYENKLYADRDKTRGLEFEWFVSGGRKWNFIVPEFYYCRDKSADKKEWHLECAQEQSTLKCRVSVAEFNASVHPIYFDASSIWDAKYQAELYIKKHLTERGST
jgi:hypothetical protein